MTDTTADKIFKQLNELSKDMNSQFLELTEKVVEVRVKLETKVDETGMIKKFNECKERHELQLREEQKNNVNWPKSFRNALYIITGGGSLSLAIKTFFEKF